MKLNWTFKFHVDFGLRFGHKTPNQNVNKMIFYCFRSGAVTGRSSATGTGTTGSGYSAATSGYSTATGSRAGTPSRGSSFEPTSINNPSTTASILAEADRRRELRNYVFNPVGKVNLKPKFCC